VQFFLTTNHGCIHVLCVADTVRTCPETLSRPRCPPLAHINYPSKTPMRRASGKWHSGPNANRQASSHPHEGFANSQYGTWSRRSAMLNGTLSVQCAACSNQRASRRGLFLFVRPQSLSAPKIAHTGCTAAHAFFTRRTNSPAPSLCTGISRDVYSGNWTALFPY